MEIIKDKIVGETNNQTEISSFKGEKNGKTNKKLTNFSYEGKTTEIFFTINEGLITPKITGVINVTQKIRVNLRY